MMSTLFQDSAELLRESFIAREARVSLFILLLSHRLEVIWETIYTLLVLLKLSLYSWPTQTVLHTNEG